MDEVTNIQAVETPVEIILIPATVNPKKVPDGTIHIVQSRPGLFVVVEFQEGVAKMKYPRMMSLCQLCLRSGCKNFKKLKKFERCTIRQAMCVSDLEGRFKELMLDLIPEKAEVQENGKPEPDDGGK